MTLVLTAPVPNERSASISDRSALSPRTRRRFYPISWPSQVVLFGCVAGIVFLNSRSTLSGWLPPMWIDANAVARESLLLLAPLLAGVGAWVGGWRHTMAVGAVPARGWSKIISAQIAPLSASIALGVLAGLAPVWAQTMRQATSHGPQPLGLLAAILAALVVLSLGYLFGVAWSSQLATPVAVVATYPLLFAPLYLNDALAQPGAQGASFLSIGLIWAEFEATPGWIESSVTATLRCVFFASVIVAALWAATRIGSHQGRGSFIAALAPFVVPIGVGVAIVLTQPSLVTPSNEVACVEDQTVALCVPAEGSAALESMHRGVSRIVESYGLGALNEPTTGPVNISNQVYLGDFTSAEDAQTATLTQLAQAISGLASCYANYESGAASTELMASEGIARALARTLVIRVDGPDSGYLDPAHQPSPDEARANDAFAAMTDAQLHTYMDQHHDELRACSATLVDLAN